MENAKIKSPVNDAATTQVRRPRRVAGTLYTADEIHEIFRRFSILRPEPKGELEHVNAFTLLVAVVLSAQATDSIVRSAHSRLWR
jgi:endonuclease-3